MAATDTPGGMSDMSNVMNNDHATAQHEDEPGTSSVSGTEGVHGDQSPLVDHVHEKPVVAAKVTKKEKIKRHCGRFWWWYLIAGIILLAIILPIIFKVIVPAIVQAIVSHQGLPVHSGFIRTISDKELILTIDTSINTAIFGVNLAPLNLYLSQNAQEDEWPFTNFTIPGMYAKGVTNALVSDQSTPVTNVSQLTSWVADLFDNPTVDLHIKGNPFVEMTSVLQYGTHLSKTISIPALNKLEGKAIDSLTLNLEGDADGNNIQGIINLPNNGVLGLYLGNLTLEMSSGTVLLGNVTVNNATLTPGDNPLPYSGALSLKAIFQNLGTVLASQAQPLSQGNIDLNITTKSVIVNGNHIPYVEDVLKQRTLTFSINAVTLVADVLSSLFHGNKKSLDTLIQDIVGNQTLLNEINNNWNNTGGPAELNRIASSNQMSRMRSRESLTWELLKLSMKMNRNKF